MVELACLQLGYDSNNLSIYDNWVLPCIHKLTYSFSICPFIYLSYLFICPIYSSVFHHSIHLYLFIYLLFIYLSTDGSSYYTQCCGGSYYTPGIDYIECSENVSSLSQCSFDTSSLSDTCSNHYNDIYVTCRRSMFLSINIYTLQKLNS